MDLENATSTNNQTVSDGMSVVDIVVIVVDIFLIVIICGGNVLTLLAVWQTPALRTVPNMYVVSLAVADLLAGLVIPYTMLVHIPGMQEILDGNFYACIFRYGLFFVSGSESMMCLLAISFDRLLYISKPLHYVTIVTPLRAGLFIALTWCFAIVYGTAPFYNNDWTPNVRCTIFTVLTIEYQAYGQCISYAVCIIICILVYMNIFKTAYRQRRSIQDTSNIGNYNERMKKSKSDWHLIKLFFLIFGVFFICWTPTFICLALGHTTGLPQTAMDIVGPLSVLNSGMNFFIYAYKNKDFRQAFARILCIRCGRSEENTDIHSRNRKHEGVTFVSNRGHNMTSDLHSSSEGNKDANVNRYTGRVLLQK